MKIAALIPARGGSKGIPRKNLVDLGGKPLIQYTIDCAKGCAAINDIFVSSDDTEILETSKKFGAKSVQRPREFAEDLSPTKDTILHFLQNYPDQFDVIALLQPTSPFRKTHQLEEAIKILRSAKARTVISVAETEVSPYRTFLMGDDKCLEPMFGEEWLYKRRQDYPKTVAANGAIYLFYVQDFLKEGNIPQKNLQAYVMDQRTSLDIDTPEDLEFARLMINR